MNNNKEKVLAAFEDRYNWIHTLAYRTGLSKTTVRKYVKILLKEGKIKRIDIGVYGGHYVYKLKT